MAANFAVQIVTNVAIHCQIEDILEQLFRHKQDRIRFYAIQEIYELWQADHKLTENLLNSLASEVKLTHPKQSLAYLDSLVKCSTLLVCREYLVTGTSSNSLEIILVIWRKLIKRYFLVSSVKPVERIVKHSRQAILSIAVARVARLLARMEEIGGAVSNFDDLVSFFPANEDRRRVFEDLFVFLESATSRPHESLASFIEYVEKLIWTGDEDLITATLVLAISTAYITNAPVETARAWHDLYFRMSELYPPTEDPKKATAPVWARMMIFTYLNPPYFRLEISEARQIVEAAIAVEYLCEERFKAASRFASGESAQWDFVAGSTSVGYWVDRELLGYPALERILKLMIERGDHRRIKRFAFAITDTTAYLNIATLGIIAVNDALSILENEGYFSKSEDEGYFSKLNEEQATEFWNDVADSLVQNYGVHHRDALKFFVDMAGDILPDGVRVRLLNASPVENFDFVIGQSVAAFARESLRDEDPAIRNLLKIFFELALEARDVKDWLAKCAGYFGNLIYGDELFPV